MLAVGVQVFEPEADAIAGTAAATKAPIVSTPDAILRMTTTVSPHVSAGGDSTTQVLRPAYKFENDVADRQVGRRRRRIARVSMPHKCDSQPGRLPHT